MFCHMPKSPKISVNVKKSQIFLKCIIIVEKWAKLIQGTYLELQNASNMFLLCLDPKLLINNLGNNILLHCKF